LQLIIREHHVDFVGGPRDKKGKFYTQLPIFFVLPNVFDWFYLPAKGTARGNLAGVREEKSRVSGVSILKYSISYILQDRKHVLIGGWWLFMVFPMMREMLNS
jgi:hypothetical protein